MTNLSVFTYTGHAVRTLAIDGEPWFVAADVAVVLGYSATEAMTRSMDADEKGLQVLHTPGGDQRVTVISEPGLYDAILRSRIPGAQGFKRWVKHDVLPTIRKTGRYGSDVEMLAALPSSQLLQLAAEAAKRAEESEAALAIATPKAEAYDAFIDADGTYSIGAVAKMVGLSQNKLFDKLRGAGVLISKGAMRNTPYQQYMHHFAVKAYEFERSNGERGTSYTTRVLPSGVEFIRRKVGALPAGSDAA
ncbi:phage antirepressor [Aeromicrobium piscarium]|uniref:Phage antirepressor n=1 Tax=Aeromicrobium piscarium TaxID=2590901 RepID=A0A554SP11_9ACTN|nr:phage antirepressor KilAC domain-containing protein [Aeromicrobium piscarium]TSD68087.1 phage antirepressor [Aeromicrobium piscarium]